MIVGMRVQPRILFSTGFIRYYFCIILKLVSIITPTGTKAMNGPFDDEYWQAKFTEIETIEGVEA